MEQNEVKDLDKRLMKRAIELSFFALENGHGSPFGSVVARDGVILGEGWNKISLTNDPSSHAELEAIRDACKKVGAPRLDGCVIYASGQPCPMCLSLIYLTGIETVYYCISGEAMTSMNPKLSVAHIYDAIGSPQSVRLIPEIQMLPEEVAPAMQRYTKWLSGHGA